MAAAAQLRPDLWRWQARHPEWEEGQDWGPEVCCYAWSGEPRALVLFDPLLTARAHWDWLESLVAGRAGPIVVAITCAWHGRSGGEVARRYGNSRPVEIHAHDVTVQDVAGRLRGLLELPIAAITPTHGAAVTHAAREELERALDAAEG